MLMGQKHLKTNILLYTLVRDKFMLEPHGIVYLPYHTLGNEAA